jgi:tetratricopeptide (TPR) repeat protein
MEALPHFERAVTLDPEFAGGHTAVAIAAAWRFFYREPTRAWEARAEAAIDRALELDPNLAEAYLARGNLLWTQPRGFPHEAALAEYRRALSLNPSSAEARVAIARLYQHIGLLNESREELRAALQLDPANEEARSRVFSTYMWQHDYASALAELDRADDRWRRIEVLTYLGRTEEARGLAAQLVPDGWVPDSAERATAGGSFIAVLLTRLGDGTARARCCQRSSV